VALAIGCCPGGEFLYQLSPNKRTRLRRQHKLSTAAYHHSVEKMEIRRTHIWVDFPAGPYAYKAKK
jgi:hypothetical protein